MCFSLQRYRYIEACQVNLKLQSMEDHFISENSVGEEQLSRMRLQRRWRTGLVVSDFKTSQDYKSTTSKRKN